MQTPLDPVRDIAVLALPDVRVSSLGTMLDTMGVLRREVLRSTGLPMQTQLRLLSTGGDAIALDDCRSLPADAHIDPSVAYRIVYVPAFTVEPGEALDERLRQIRRTISWLRLQHDRYALIAASGPSTALLAEAGILDQGMACVPQELSGWFQHRYPQVRQRRATTFAEHDGAFTCATLSGEWAMVTRLVELVLGPQLAQRFATTVDEPESHESPSLLASDPLVAQAQLALSEHYADVVSIAELAGELGVSHPTLIRRFDRALGTTPYAYLQSLRVDAGKRMLSHTNRSVDQIGSMVGYADARSFRAAFLRHAGQSPSAFRDAVRDRSRPPPHSRRANATPR